MFGRVNRLNRLESDVRNLKTGIQNLEEENSDLRGWLSLLCKHFGVRITRVEPPKFPFVVEDIEFINPEKDPAKRPVVKLTRK